MKERGALDLAGEFALGPGTLEQCGAQGSSTLCVVSRSASFWPQSEEQFVVESFCLVLL